MKILIASGGSGGHIFPAVSLARELKKENSEIMFVASRRRLDKIILDKTDYKKVYISANPMPYRIGFKSLIFCIKFILDSLFSIYLLLLYKPNVVVGFGGYTSGALVLIASLMGIKTVIHEQNLVPGRTNKFLDKFVDKIAISFPDTGKYFKNKNVIFTGNPLREESLKECRNEALSRFGFDSKKITILVMGGSQGAKSLNELVARSIELMPLEKKRILQIVHITGSKNKELVESVYNKNSIPSKVVEFIRNINEAYSVADIAISRSGAAAIFELASFKKPMILVPYPNKKNNQRFNAEFFENNSAAICLDETKIDSAFLKEIIVDLIDNPKKREILSKNAEGLSVKDGATRLKEVVLNAA